MHKTKLSKDVNFWLMVVFMSQSRFHSIARRSLPNPISQSVSHSASQSVSYSANGPLLNSAAYIIFISAQICFLFLHRMFFLCFFYSFADGIFSSSCWAFPLSETWGLFYHPRPKRRNFLGLRRTERQNKPTPETVCVLSTTPPFDLSTVMTKELSRTKKV